MSRSLGDITAHNVGVSAKPDRTHYVIDPQDEFVVFGSDGIWQVLEDQEVRRCPSPLTLLSSPWRHIPDAMCRSLLLNPHLARCLSAAFFWSNPGSFMALVCGLRC